MLLSHVNTEFPGVGVALFSVIIFAVLLFWNAYNKSLSGHGRTVNGMLISGIVHGLATAAIIITSFCIPEIYNNPAVKYVMFIDNVAVLLLLLFSVSYIQKKTADRPGGGRLLMIPVYLVSIALFALYVANLFIRLGSQPLYNELTKDGIIYNQAIFGIHMECILLMELMPVIFVIKSFRKALPKERVILFLFAFIPIAFALIALLVYAKDEVNPTFINYTVLAILMVFFDQIQLDANNSKQAALAEKLAFEAMHDRVTGLTIPEVFERHVDEILAETGSRGCCFAVIDIDNFRKLNEIYGRQFGDDVLRQAADILKDTVRPEDVTGRVGDDGFGVFFRCEDRYFEPIVSKMRDRLEFESDGVDISASVGAVQVSDNDSDFDYLFALADRALNQAKKEGTASYRLIYK